MYPNLSETVDLLKLNYRILGSDVIKSDLIFSYKAYDSSRIIKGSNLMSPNYKKFKFLEYDDVGKIIKIKEGAWKLEKDLIIQEQTSMTLNKDYQLLKQHGLWQKIYTDN